MLPFFAAIALFVMLVLLWLGERVADREERRRPPVPRRLRPGPPRN